MLKNEDWLQDPFAKKGIYSNFLVPKVIEDSEFAGQWNTFHYATRLKLDGAAYFCRQV